MTKIKLCGIKTLEAIEEANRLKVDFVGFVFASSSKRCVTLSAALKLKSALNREVKAVGVFKDNPLSEILDIFRSGAIDIIQLHGYSEKDALALKSAGGIVMRAFNDPLSLEEITSNAADLILIDARKSGSGELANWDGLKSLKRPYFLAGGLNSDNIKEAIETLHPSGVDVSSGIETNGEKDIKKMEAFVRAVREAGK
ncbi:MAG: phosphoribosylanthranilate isomerase [Clostridia bacterium]|nr:phosphoribosylanthranilate isomerase [Clostridia bacterium]